MKKLLIFGLLCFVAYKLYQRGSFELPSNKPKAFDAAGKPIVRLFLGPDCGEPCTQVEDWLRERRQPYESFDIASETATKHGVNRYPVVQVGNDTVVGNNRIQFVSALAANLGESALMRAERIATQEHFATDGKPTVVLYGVQWCGYCKLAREHFAAEKISFTELDPELSPAAKAAFDSLSGRGYPLIYVGYRFVPFENITQVKMLLASGGK